MTLNGVMAVILC